MARVLKTAVLGRAAFGGVFAFVLAAICVAAPERVLPAHLGPAAVQGLDHIPLAVRDLDHATADFERLGFVLKPGRAHDDGIRNRHIKFPDGTSLELITPPIAPTDELTSEYLTWLKSGDGPAFWSLRSDDLPSLARRLKTLKPAPQLHGGLVDFPFASSFHQLFFAGGEKSPTDRPEYFAHPNTAYRLAAIWLADSADQRQLVLQLGARGDTRSACSPFDRHAETTVLPDGTHIVFSRVAKAQLGRAVMGATILVRSLAKARQMLETGHVTYLTPRACADRSLWIPASETHGLWLELRE